MKYEVYAVKDSITGFNQPACELNQAAALRSFKNLINLNEAFRINAGDYSLFKIADFDTDTGYCTGIDPVFIVSGSSVLEVNNA
ncbi:nonstructural protein [Capybara microvirus Cap1_SP_147]|nr:nonstructural protein [Capybara microvirus Cap1_SP_147]